LVAPAVNVLVLVNVNVSEKVSFLVQGGVANMFTILLCFPVDWLTTFRASHAS
jgi:hypothetical protein